MIGNYLQSAEAYYQAMNNKDIIGMATYLHPNVQFLGPLAELSGKATILDSVKNLFSLFENLTIRTKFSSGDQGVLIYDLNCIEPLGTLRVAALLSFQDHLISRIELFFDARPFEKKA